MSTTTVQFSKKELENVVQAYLTLQTFLEKIMSPDELSHPEFMYESLESYESKCKSTNNIKPYPHKRKIYNKKLLQTGNEISLNNIDPVKPKLGAPLASDIITNQRSNRVRNYQ